MALAMKTINHGFSFIYCVFIQGVIQLFVVAYDGYSISGNDLIDRFVIDFSVTSSSSLYYQHSLGLMLAL